MGTLKIVSGSGMAGFGSSNTIVTRKINDRFYLCGDAESDMNDGLALVAPRVAICAAHEANMNFKTFNRRERGLINEQRR